MEILAGICLLMQSVCDIRNKEIPMWISLSFGGISTIYSWMCQREWSSFCISFLTGVVCLIIAYCTRQAIGFGDGILLCSLATLYSLKKIMEIIVVAISIAGVIGLILLVVFRKSGKYEMPFVPFLFIGWIFSRGSVFVEGVI